MYSVYHVITLSSSYLYWWGGSLKKNSQYAKKNTTYHTYDQQEICTKGQNIIILSMAKRVIYAEQIYEKTRDRGKEESRGEEIKPNGDAVRFNVPT